MRWFLGIIVGIIGFVSLLIIGLLLTIFFRPELLINRKVIEYALDKTQVFEYYSLGSLHLEHTREGLWERRLQLTLGHFNFHYLHEQAEVDTHLTYINLAVRLRIFPTLNIKLEDDIFAHFSHLHLLSKVQADADEPTDPTPLEALDLKAQWDQLWSDIVPTFQVQIEDLKVSHQEIELQTPVYLRRLPDQYLFTLNHNELMVIMTPTEFKLSLAPSLHSPLWRLANLPIEHNGLTLTVVMQEESVELNSLFFLGSQGIELDLSLPHHLKLKPEAIYQLNSLRFNVHSLLGVYREIAPALDQDKLELPSWIDDFDGNLHLHLTGDEHALQFFTALSIVNNKTQKDIPGLEIKASLPRRDYLPIDQPEDLQEMLLGDFLANFRFELDLEDLVSFSSDHYPEVREYIPAPFNQIKGPAWLSLSTSNDHAQDPFTHELNASFGLRMSGAKQYLEFDLNFKLPFEVRNFTFGGALIDLDVGKLHLDLPRISPRARPPQVVSDQRFVQTTTTSEVVEEEGPNFTPPPIDLTIKTPSNSPVTLRSHLVDEPIRLDLNLRIVEGKLRPSTITLLPLRTSVFRRPLYIPQVVFTLDEESQHVRGTIEFHLPSYLVRYHFEGPPDQLQSRFESVPPLPLEDIYSVLLFGRPMADLGMDDQEATNRSMQILSQGLFSLTTLYFFAGSPVESLGYNPNRSEVYAQFGLGARSSLRVTSGPEGSRSAGIRRSLGAGWYLDTSVSQEQSNENSQQAVLLERVIAY